MGRSQKNPSVVIWLGPAKDLVRRVAGRDDPVRILLENQPDRMSLREFETKAPDWIRLIERVWGPAEA